MNGKKQSKPPYSTSNTQRNKTMPSGKEHLFKLTLQRFRRAIGMLARSEQGAKAKFVAGCLVVLMLGINGLNVLNSYVGRDFMTAIQDRNMPGFLHYTVMYLMVFGASTLTAVLFRFAEERLGLLWREQLTERMMGAYLDQRTYYRLDGATGIANPDQRLAEDIRAFTTTTLSFSLLIINGTLTALSFSGVLWTISPWLFVVAVAYALCGTLLTVWLGRPLIRLNYHQLDLEANFRADLIHVRENSESIALSHREGRFKLRLNHRLNLLVRNYRRIISVNRNLGFFTTGYNYMIQIIPALIIAPLFIGGKIEFGVITQSAMAFATLVGAFSLIVTQFQSISAFTAVTARLYGLGEAIETAHTMQVGGIACPESPAAVRYHGVTLRSSDKSRTLIEKLNVTFAAASRWVVTGQEDAPKVALFRATAGLWENGEGNICRPGLDEILFLPERPYLPPGTLREVLLRTGREYDTPDAVIRGVLASLEMDTVVARVGGLDSSQDWDDLLSIGEQHMLSLARILLAKPAFVLLDRPGSSLPKPQIVKVLELLTAGNIGCVVLAKNGESQLSYDGRLEIHNDGSWTVREDDPAKPSDPLDDLTC